VLTVYAAIERAGGDFASSLRDRRPAGIVVSSTQHVVRMPDVSRAFTPKL
jgi:hypothetical protein